MKLQIILKYLLVALSVINLGISIYTNFNHIYVLQDLKILVGVPINGFDVIDKEYLNLLLTGSNNVDITSIRLHGVRIYAIRDEGVLYTIENNLNYFLFLLYN